jgi:hypothetical protein
MSTLSAHQQNFKAAVRHAVKKAGGPIVVAEQIGVSENEISLWRNDHNTRFVPIDHAFDLDVAAGDDIMLKTWARMRGYDLLSREAKIELADNVVKIVGRLAKAGGTLECAALNAFADNKITPTPNEVRAIRDDIVPVKDSIEQLERAISR